MCARTRVRTDAALAIVALLAFTGAILAVDASLSSRWLLAGGLGTIAFEGLAMRRRETVRAIWERPTVQLASLAGAVALAVFGALVAPSSVLSAAIGALVSYLLILAIVATGSLR